ncbi:MAG: hypothetical protein WD076_05760 [Parvularculaceae bacterium]
MKLRIFSVAGEALNFGLRRMETIMRVAWLPLGLILVFDMTRVFVILSIANGRVITFGDLAANVTFQRAAVAANRLLEKGLDENSATMWIIYVAWIAINTILLASFMAPLIRFAGLGERPAPGAFRAPFGPDQARYIVALIVAFFVSLVIVWGPIWATSLYIFKYVGEAMQTTYASFPNPDSLHTVKDVLGLEVMKASDRLWIPEFGLWTAATVVLFLIAWVALVLHFRPSGSAGAAKAARPLARTGVVFLVLAAYVLAIATRASGDRLNIGQTADAAFFAFLALSVLFIVYAGLRLFPYSGVVVCRKSLAFGNTFAVTRGWNLVRMVIALLVLFGVLFAAFLLINLIAVPAIFSVTGILEAAVASYTKLYNSGEVSLWVAPAFAWVRTILAIIINVFWAFFTYGVNAGLLGRLFRESERTD